MWSGLDNVKFLVDGIFEEGICLRWLHSDICLRHKMTQDYAKSTPR